MLDDPEAAPALRRALRAEVIRVESHALRAAVTAALGGQVTWAASTAAAAEAGAAAIHGASAAAGKAGVALFSAGVVKSFAIGAGIGTVIAAGAPAVLSTLDSPRGASASVPGHVTVERRAPHANPPSSANPSREDEPQRHALHPTERGDRPKAGFQDVESSSQAGPRMPSPPSDREATEISAEPPLQSLASQAKEETARMALARRQLRAGRGAECLAELAALDREQPSGVLQQEREVLRVEALVVLGRGVEAERAATDFLRRYPESPHAGRVRSWTRRE